MTTLDRFKLDGKVALVTGANRGLGEAMAVALAEAGADVAGLSRADLGSTAAQVEATGQHYQHITLDLGAANVTDLQNVISEVINRFGRLDILINNAGIIHRTPALDYAESEWDDVLQINLKAVFFLSQGAAKHMALNGGGKIIHIASMLSYQGGIIVPAYTASKHGIMGITRALANEWAKHNINVNAIAPGYMHTDNTAALRADVNRNQRILDRIPAGYWGTPDDLKGAVVFLASDAARYVHGAILPVDGAWLSS